MTRSILADALLALLFAVLLAACGGGDPEPEEELPRKGPPVDCKLRPELCE